MVRRIHFNKHPKKNIPIPKNIAYDFYSLEQNPDETIWKSVTWKNISHELANNLDTHTNRSDSPQTHLKQEYIKEAKDMLDTCQEYLEDLSMLLDSVPFEQKQQIAHRSKVAQYELYVATYKKLSIDLELAIDNNNEYSQDEIMEIGHLSWDLELDIKSLIEKYDR